MAPKKLIRHLSGKTAMILLFLTLTVVSTACQNVGNTAVLPTPVEPLQLMPPSEEAIDTQPANMLHEPPANLVVLWNEVMLAAVRNGPPRPTVIARSLYMVHEAMYDAWTAYDAAAVPTVLDPAVKRPLTEHTNTHKGEAVSQAAYHMLVTLFPEYEKNTHAFTNLLHELGYEVATQADPTTPAGIGYMAAQAVITDRANDGANAANNYADTTSDIYPQLYTVVNSADPLADNAPGHAGFNPNHWQPLRVPTGTRQNEAGWPMVDHNDPASYRDQVFLTPHWGMVRPFALTSGSQFRPPMPPQAGSSEPYTDAAGNTMTHDEAYHIQTDEILNLSANLTDEQKVIAEYWADGPRSETPPGHWNALTHGICYRDQHTIDDDIKLFFALNGAVFDSSIAAWEAKRYYDYVRPASAIQHKYAGQVVAAWGGPNQGTQLIPGETWRPYQSLTFVTPPFAEYVSGHSTFSAAAAEVLTRFTGSNQFYDGVTVLFNEDFNRDGIPDLLGQHILPVGGNMFESSPVTVVTLHWETFQEAADEAGMSRRYGGIHFQDADLYGRQMGQQIGSQAFALAEQYWTGQIQRP